jgi:site-specific recombinase XerC
VGKEFAARHDTAIIMLLWGCGLRRAELGRLKFEDIDWQNDVVLMLGKGRKQRACPFGKAADRALDRYLRARDAHRRLSPGDRL